MGYASKEALLEYTQNKSVASMSKAAGAGMLLLSLLFFGFDSSGTEKIFGLVFLVGGALGLYSGLTWDSAYKKFLNTAASTGELTRLLEDFAASQSMADDRIRLGANYLYGKKQGRPIRYSDLAKVYPHVVTGSHLSRSLVCVTIDGKTSGLCNFIVRDDPKIPHPDEALILHMIRTKNPNVYLGYK